MKKIVRTYRFDEDVIEHSLNNYEIPSFADFCCNKYREEFMTLEKEMKALEFHTKKVEMYEKNIEHLKKVGDHSMFRLEEIDWVKDLGINVFREYSERGALVRFNNHFGRSIKIGQFRRLVEHIEESLEGCDKNEK